MTDNPQAETALVEGPQTVSHNANELRRKLATAERIRENADFHLGQEMARRQLAEKETARLRAELAALSTPTSTAPLAAGLSVVQGRCPACGTAGLFLGSGGYVTCSLVDCPEPDAATTVLEGGANWPAVRAAVLREATDEVTRWYVDTEQAQRMRDAIAYRVRRMADEAQQPETQADTRAAVIAEILPDWEAVYEPGNVSDYLIGYANDEAPAKGAAEAWLRSQAEVTGRLEWVPDEQLATGRYDQWFELIERHDGGIDTGPGLIVRRRVADEAQPDPCSGCRYVPCGNCQPSP